MQYEYSKQTNPNKLYEEIINSGNILDKAINLYYENETTYIEVTPELSDDEKSALDVIVEDHVYETQKSWRIKKVEARQEEYNSLTPLEAKVEYLAIRMGILGDPELLIGPTED